MLSSTVFDPEKNDFRSSSYLKHLKLQYGVKFDRLWVNIKTRQYFDDYTRLASELGINLAAYSGLYNVQKFLFSGYHDDWDKIINGVSSFPISMKHTLSIRGMIGMILRRLNEKKMAEIVTNESSSNEQLIRAILFLCGLLKTDFVVSYIPPTSKVNAVLQLARLFPKEKTHVAEDIIFVGHIPRILKDATVPLNMPELQPKLSVLQTLIHFEPTTNFEKFSLVIWMCMNFVFDSAWTRSMDSTQSPIKVGSFSKKIILLTTVVAVLLIYFYYQFYMKSSLPTIRRPPPPPPPLPKFEDFDFEVGATAKSAYYHG